MGGAASGSFLVLACDSLTASGRKLPGDIGGGGDGGGARGDVRGGAARAGRRRRQCLRDARGGRSLTAELHSLPACCFGAAVPASERVPANPRWRGPSSQPLRLTAGLPARPLPPSAASRRFPLGRFPPASSCSPSKLQT